MTPVRVIEELIMPFKFEALEIWHLAIDYVDLSYGIAEHLPKTEEFNLKSQLRRAATSIALNIAEGSTGQANAEQARFLSYALRSLVETVACQHLIRRRMYAIDEQTMQAAYQQAEVLARKIQALRKTLSTEQRRFIQETTELYVAEDTDEQ